MRNIYFLIAVFMLSANVKADEGLNDLLKSNTATSAPTAVAAPKELTLLEKIAQFEKGKTTYADVVRELGQPNKVVVNAEGIKTVKYGNTRIAFAGAALSKASSASLFFDKNDILVWMTTTQN